MISTLTPKILVIHHKSCPSGDGFGAAFAAWLSLGESADYLALDHADEPPCVTGMDVFILDLSFSVATMKRLGIEARSLTLLDHHVTGARELASFKPACCGKIHFDLGRSGAVLAWMHFHPGEPIPKLFVHIQDRDLWTWREPDSKAYLAWLDSRPKDFAAWSDILAMDPEQTAQALSTGRALSDQVDRLCAAVAAKSAPIEIDGRHGLMVNATGEFRSQIGSILAEKAGGFGAVWRVAEDGRVHVSLRSIRGCDVEGMASARGGGGHPNAAAFSLPPEALPDLARGWVGAPANLPT